MTEKQLISKIQKLKKIKPDPNWVFFAKEKILGREEKPEFSFLSFIKEIQKGERFVFNHKPAFAFITCLVVLIGLFGFAQNSVPGESLFTLKRITEQGQSVFIPKKDQTKHNLELANRRLDDLTKIAETNEINKLAPAINEYQETVSKAAESLAKEDNPEAIKEIAGVIKELEQKEEEIKSLGIEIGENEELRSVLAQIVEQIVENEIKDLETRSLTEEQEESLSGIKQDYEEGEYSKALEKILILY